MRQPDRLATAILVVDDDDSIVELVKAFLENAGHAVFVAGDGDAGLALFQQHQPAISLVLTDVEMPRMNGLDMADRILRLDSDLPVLFMSGANAAANRGYGCVAKPFHAADLLARVGCALGAVQGIHP